MPGMSPNREFLQLYTGAWKESLAVIVLGALQKKVETAAVVVVAWVDGVGGGSSLTGVPSSRYEMFCCNLR